ncbi:unnamed protein product [Cutaneotrichosporon oleaginosum]
MPSSHPDGRDPRYDAHLAPTLADVPLNPRRRLRDGTESASTSASVSSSRSSSCGNALRGVKRTRSTRSDTDDVGANAEASRRLPALHPRLPRPEPHQAGDEEEVFTLSPDPNQAEMMDIDARDDERVPPGSSTAPDTEAGPSGPIPEHTEAKGDLSSDDEPLRRRSRSFSRPEHRGEGRATAPAANGDASGHDNSLESALADLHSSPHSNHNRSPSPASTSTSSGPRYTAQEKGKGRAIQRSVIDVSDDEHFDESIQFIESRAAAPIAISDDEPDMDKEPPEAAIDDESAISAFSEQIGLV